MSHVSSRNDSAPPESASRARVRTSSVAGCLSLHVDGRFDFNCYRDFRCAYEEAPGPVTEYVVDLKGTDYIDSAALGMLLLLRDHSAAKVRIVNPRPTVRRILLVAHFNSLFAID